MKRNCSAISNLNLLFLTLPVLILLWTKVSPPGPKVCVIGAGIAGLTSAKYLKEEGIDFTVFESTQYVGGTWRYEPRVGTDEYGLPLLGSTYKNLRTNLPKPAMELKGFSIPDDMPSFPTWKAYYKYVTAYSKHFELENHIKFLHMIVSVRRVDNVWEVKYKNISSGEEFSENFDYVIVGSGHFSKPNLPDIPGEKLFKGTIVHSHDYREPDAYKCRRVLIVGAGPSGLDIGLDVATVTKKLVHSHHSPVKVRTKFPSNYFMKPDIKKFNETGVTFVDDTYEEIDDVIYCTGFQYYYPFLDESSGLNLTPGSVTPLYKYMVNINQPSMIMMGLVVRACVVVALDAQARYATALIKGNFSLPSKEEMKADWQKRADKIRSKGRLMSDIHLLAGEEDQYYADLSKQSGIERVLPVFFKIRHVNTEAKLDDLLSYRNYAYTILDNETFTRSIEEETLRKYHNTCTP